MKTLKILIRIEAVLLAVLGWLEAFANRNLGEAGANRAPQDDLALSFLGMGFLVFAVLLFLGSDLMLVGNRRRLGRWLAGGNALLALSAFVHGSGEPLDWILLLVPAGMAVALAWASAVPLKPEAAAAELAEARIPDEVRQALLRQVREAAAQEERNRLARDLHDSIKQQLFTINVGAATAQERWERDPEGARAALADVRRSAREAMAEMQAMLHQLRPQALASTTGLVGALREQAEALGYRSGARVRVALGVEIPDDRMPPGALEALFRIAQEALANVARHARAETVRVWLGREGEEAVLQVEDDGQGFDPKAAVSGMGLRNLYERATALRGRVEIESTPGSGSTVRVRIPLLPPAAPAPKSFADQVAFVKEWVSSPWFPWSLAILSVLSADNYEYGLFEILFYVLTPLLWALDTKISVRGERRRSAEPSSDIARLRFLSHLRILSCIFSAALGAGAFWAQSRDQFSNGLFWLTVAGLCLVWAFFELVVFHGWSEWRREWRTFVQPVRWSFNTLMWVSLIVYWGLNVPFLSPAQTALSAMIVALLLYLLSRQPRLQGAHP